MNQNKLMSEKAAIGWEKQRSLGKGWWIGRSTLVLGLLFFVTNNLVSWFDGSELKYSLRTVIISLVTGLFVSMFLWWHTERSFRRYINNKSARLNPV